MPMFMDVKDYARYRPCSVRAVYKACETNRIKRRASDGLINVDEADRDWELNTNPALQREVADPKPSEPLWDFNPATGTFSERDPANTEETDWDTVLLPVEQWDALIRHRFPSVKFEQ